MALAGDSELERRWSAWLLAQNRRGLRVALAIAACLYPAFGVLDYLASRDWLWPAQALGVAVGVISWVLFRAVKSPLFERHPHAICAGYMLLICFGISVMMPPATGLSSPHRAALALTLVALSQLFIWPPRVVVATHATIVIASLVPSLVAGRREDWLTAMFNQLLLMSTAIICGVGQTLAYTSQREQIESQHQLETRTKSLELAQQQRDLFDLRKLEESRLRLRIEAHDLVEYLRGLVAQIHPFAARKGIAISFRSDVRSTLIWCDVERIERVFLNLLSNAAKFAAPGGSILVELSDEADALRVSVSDTGVGFPSEMVEQVFERFVRADTADTRRHPAAGIGLALAKELVELHGGKIWAESAPGVGARFSVRLQKGREHFSEAVLERREQRVDRMDRQRETDGGLDDWQHDAPQRFRLLEVDEATEQRLLERDADENEREHTVLVVEDTPDVARVVRLALHHEFRFLAAQDGQKGLELARRHRPTIIITDWMMPKMDGLELTRRLRKDPETKHIPIVMLSARALVEDRVQSLDAGVNAYLAKPFAASELISTVRALLRIREDTADALLTQKMDSLEIIAGGLAHEINNPLNYLKNALASVERDCQTLLTSARESLRDPPQSGVVEKLDTRIHKMFEVSRAGAARIASTVELMLRYSREGYSRSARAYDAFAAVRDVARVVMLTLSHEVELTLDLADDVWINCVPEEFNQVLTNLIQNALEAAPADGTGQVFVKGRGEGGDLVLSVKDNGPGIKERDRARVFEAFFTTKGVGQGMGLGLTITRRVVHAMGGTLALKSQVGAGSEFVIRVPRLLSVEAVG